MAAPTKPRKPYASGPNRDYAAAGLLKASVPLPYEVVQQAKRLAQLAKVPAGTFLANLIIVALKKMEKTK